MPLLLFVVALFGAGFALLARARPRPGGELGELAGNAELLAANAFDGGPPLPDSEADPAPAVFSPLPILMSSAKELAGALGAAARKIYVLPDAGAPFAELIIRAEQQHGIPETLLARVLFQESRFIEDIITGRQRSPAGALGIAQFMPATARELGIDPLIPAQAIPAAAKYLRRLFDATGNWPAALAAYNWGIGNVTRKGIAAAPMETQNYLRDVLRDVDVA